MFTYLYLFTIIYVLKNACLPLQKIINPSLFSFKNCLIDSIIIDEMTAIATIFFQILII